MGTIFNSTPSTNEADLRAKATKLAYQQDDDGQTIVEWMCCQCANFVSVETIRWDCSRCHHGLCPYCPRKRKSDVLRDQGKQL